jgi:hypothetical protein
MKFLIAVAMIACFLSPAQAGSDSRYLAMLAQAAADMNLTVSLAAKKCVLDTVSQIPESVKAKASEIRSIDANTLIAAGVPVRDVEKAVNISRPCRNQIAIDNSKK